MFFAVILIPSFVKEIVPSLGLSQYFVKLDMSENAMKPASIVSDEELKVSPACVGIISIA